MRSAVNFKVNGRDLTGIAKPVDSLFDVIEARSLFKRMRAALESLGGVYAEEYAQLEAVHAFAAIVISASSLDTFEVPTRKATDDELVAGFMRFIQLPMDVMQAWTDALTRAATPEQDRALLPPEELTEAELSFTQSGDKESETLSPLTSSVS